jgi:hypothetical protein
MSIRERYHRAHNWLKAQAFLDNWTFWHTLWGMIGARVFLIWLPPWACVAIVFAAGVAWEVIEYCLDKWHPYGSVRRWLNNTLSDIFVETLAAALVVF